MIDIDAMCEAANARLRKSIAKSAGQHKRHIRKLAERLMEDGRPRVRPTGTFGIAGTLKPLALPARPVYLAPGAVLTVSYPAR